MATLETVDLKQASRSITCVCGRKMTVAVLKFSDLCGTMMTSAQVTCPGCQTCYEKGTTVVREWRRYRFRPVAA